MDHAAAQRERTRSVGAFFVLAVGISWVLWAPLVVFDGRFAGAPLLGIAGAFGPLLAAAILTYRDDGDLQAFWRPILRWRAAWYWWLTALFGPVAVAALGALLARGVVGRDLAAPSDWTTFVPVLVFSVLVGGGQEEPGWRGFAQRHLQEGVSAFWASLIVGAVWVVWHLPLFAIDGSTQSQVGLSLWVYALYVPALSVLLAWMYNVAGRSVLVCAVFHASFNAAGVTVYPIEHPTAQVLLVVLAWAAAAAVTTVSGPRRLGRPDPTESTA